MATSQDFVNWVCSDALDPRFLMYGLMAEGDHILNFGKGTTHTTVYFPEVLAFHLCLAPLAEQKRIVAKVEKLLAAVNAARERLARVPAILRLFRQAVLYAASDGTLTEAWRTAQGDWSTWPVVTLRSVAQELAYGTSARSAASGRVPVLRMGNIQGGLLDWSDLVYTSDIVEISRYRLSTGDVLFNRTNSPELVGKTAVFRGEREAIFAGYLIRVRCGAHLLPDYLAYCLNGPVGREYVMQVKTDGVSQSNVNAKNLAAFEFALPPLTEQHEIVRRVEALFSLADAIEKRVSTARARANRLTEAILAKAFRGELVPTEAELARSEGRDYEPASVLLERIRGERALTETPGRQKSRKRKRK